MKRKVLAGHSMTALPPAGAGVATLREAYHATIVLEEMRIVESSAAPTAHWSPSDTEHRLP
jgi:hypothetical protein